MFIILQAIYWSFYTDYVTYDYTFFNRNKFLIIWYLISIYPFWNACLFENIYNIIKHRRKIIFFSKGRHIRTKVMNFRTSLKKNTDNKTEIWIPKYLYKIIILIILLISACKLYNILVWHLMNTFYSNLRDEKTQWGLEYIHSFWAPPD